MILLTAIEVSVVAERGTRPRVSPSSPSDLLGRFEFCGLRLILQRYRTADADMIRKEKKKKGRGQVVSCTGKRVGFKRAESFCLS